MEKYFLVALNVLEPTAISHVTHLMCLTQWFGYWHVYQQDPGIINMTNFADQVKNMFPKPLIPAHGPNDFKLGLFCNT